MTLIGALPGKELVVRIARSELGAQVVTTDAVGDSCADSETDTLSTWSLHFLLLATGSI